MSLKKLPRSFYLRPTLKVARELLGCFLVRRIGRQQLVGKIVEVEAYLGTRDAASHAYRGRTQRNEVMFRTGGHLYVYFTYGMHYCSNVVTEEEGTGHAVLLRAIEPVAGVRIMQRNRGLKATDGKALSQNLTNGPAKLCKALRIAREENGTDLLGNEIFIAAGEHIPRNRIRTSPRIGVRNAIDKRWRFYIKGNPWVSKQ